MIVWGHDDIWVIDLCFQWDCFLWTDYVQRQRASATFLARHLPLSDGNDDANFDGRLHFDWDKHKYSPHKKTHKSKSVPKAKLKPASKSASASAPLSKQIMVYDVEKDCLVPMDMD